MKIDPDSVPSTIKAAVDMMVAGLTDEDREFIKQAESVVSCHHTVGRYIRNNWSLWDNSTPLKHDAATKYKIAHADDVSGLILDWVASIVRQEPFDPMEAVERYHKHWAMFGVTSLQAGNYQSSESEPS